MEVNLILLFLSKLWVLINTLYNLLIIELKIAPTEGVDMAILNYMLDMREKGSVLQSFYEVILFLIWWERNLKVKAFCRWRLDPWFMLHILFLLNILDSPSNNQKKCDQSIQHFININYSFTFALFSSILFPSLLSITIKKLADGNIYIGFPAWLTMLL